MLLFCLLAAYLIVRVSEDVSASVRGHTPPRHEYRMAKLSARERGGGQVPQSPAGRYLSGLLDDAWNSAHHRRELMADHRKNKREQRAANTIERSRTRAAGKAEKHRQPDPVGFDVDAPTAVTDPDPGADSVTDEPGRGESTPGESVPTDATGPAVEQTRAETDTDPTTGASPTVEPVTGQSDPMTQEASEPAATSDDTTDPDTSPTAETATPGAGNPSTETPHRMEFPMTAPATEVTGLASAITYAEGLEKYCRQTSDTVTAVLPTADNAISMCEQARENLSIGGVTGQALTEVASVQDEMTEAIRAVHTALSQLEAAGSSATALKATLIRHQQTVGEAYTANPDAGSKEFVTAE